MIDGLVLSRSPLRCAAVSGLFVAPVLTVAILGYGDGPRPRYTGGFAEKTCVSCHNSFSLNEGTALGGSLTIEGVPAKYEPGEAYPLKVRLSHPGQSRWGFQLSSRFGDSGGQAGELKPLDEFTQVKEASGVSYIEHTEEGSREGLLDGPVEFTFEWVAPTSSDRLVVFNSAGNAADNSWDPKGDYVYVAGSFSRPVSISAPLTDATETEERELIRANNESRFIHLPAPTDLEPHNTEVHIEHRFLQSFEDATAGNAFGLDGPANINLGLNYALNERLSAGISRARFEKIVALTGTLELQTDDESPWRLSLLGGVQGRENFGEHYSAFFQLAGSVDHDRFRFFGVPTVVVNSRNEEEVAIFRDPINPDRNSTLALGLGVDAALNRSLSFGLEFVPRLAGFGGFRAEHPAMSAAFKIRSWGHVFSILVSTSRAFTPAEYAVNTEKDFSLGFNIYRRIR